MIDRETVLFTGFSIADKNFIAIHAFLVKIGRYYCYIRAFSPVGTKPEIYTGDFEKRKL